jgi:hypothetical protein
MSIYHLTLLFLFSIEHYVAAILTMDSCRRTISQRYYMRYSKPKELGAKKARKIMLNSNLPR